MRARARWLLHDRRGNLVAAAAALALGVALTPLVPWLGRAAESEAADIALLALFLVAPSVLFWAAFAFLAARWVGPRWQAPSAGLAAYLALGLGTALLSGCDGLGGDCGALVLAWPSILVGLHDCFLPFGLWECPAH